MINKTKTLNIIAVGLLFTVIIISCNNNKNKEVNDGINTKAKKDSLDYGLPKFLNRLNLPEMQLPVIGHFSSPDIFDTLDFSVKESTEYLYDFTMFTKGHEKNGLNITIASEVHFYDEGDLNGDGTHEIGIIPGYNTSACRNYLVYTFKNDRWRLLYEISSHMGDRERGIDYVKRIGDSIRILSADDGCCQCFGLDTTFEKIKK